MNRKAQRLRAVLFDFDGTIADTGRGIKNSIRYSLEKKQIPVGNPENLDYFIGPPLYEGYAHVYGTKEPLTSELVDLYRVYYAEKGVYELDVYPGIRELLENLRAVGVKTAVTSSKPLHFLQMAVPFAGLAPLFDVVVGPELQNKNADKCFLIRQALDRLGLETPATAATSATATGIATEPSVAVAPLAGIFMVGDRHYDITGGKDAGLCTIGVTYGFGTEEELRAAGADAIVHTPSALQKYLLP